MRQATITLRPWQQAALSRLATHPTRDFLTVATPGAGKTTFALVALNQELNGRVGPAIIVAPTAHLKVQWAQAAATMGIHLDPNWESGTPFGEDMHGIVTTYQQVALAADDLYALSWDGVVILDEVHHAGDEMAWGDAVGRAFELARRRIALSGTPFRSDTAAIPFVSYHLEEAQADFEYGYGDALRDGVVRPVYFPRIGGDMEWISPDGAHYAASFEDKLNAQLTAQRLRTALSPQGAWLPEVLAQANDTLEQLRATSQPNAGGLVICMDTDHARAVGGLLAEITGRPSLVATSDDPKASQIISDFTTSEAPWIVAVRMISEGVDIPRLRVGVFATTITTELFFRQAVGRLVRVTPDTLGARSVMFIPNDPRLRQCAQSIAEPRYHLLRAPEPEVDEPGASAELDDPLALSMAGDPEPISLFEAIRADAVASGEPLPEWLASEPFPTPAGQPGLAMVLSPPPTPSGKVVDPSAPGKTRAQTKTALRKHNADLVRIIVQRTGQTPVQVNATLNREVGIAKVSEADMEELQERIEAALAWVDELTD